MCHAPATLFRIEKRGYLRAGYFADLVIVDPEKEEVVSKENIHYKCGWSPMEGRRFTSTVEHTIVSGHLAYSQGQFDENKIGHRLSFSS